jgi:signal transduction histidine kinase
LFVIKKNEKLGLLYYSVLQKDVILSQDFIFPYAIFAQNFIFLFLFMLFYLKISSFSFLCHFISGFHLFLFFIPFYLKISSFFFFNVILSQDYIFEQKWWWWL